MTTPHLTSGPRGVPTRPLHERQLDADMIQLQRAASASHQRGQLIEAIRNAAALGLAILGLIVTAVGHGRALSALLGASWFIISLFVLKNVMARTAKQGALLQEQFDTTLFDLPWRRTVVGDPLADHDVARLARRLTIDGIRDQRITSGWYDPTSGVHHPYDVLISQEQNLAWDARLRRTYAAKILSAAILWGATGVVIAVVTGTTITNILLSFYTPSLAALQLAHEIWAGQRRVADERERLAKIVNTELRDGQPGPVPEDERLRLRDVARDLQDGIFRTRLDVARVPEWLYRFHRGSDEADFSDAAERHRRRLAA
ncbi:S-4TM family putative pore-forming effector [Micromonospora matsumotoense]|uniref:S-4TM family putative pore-forming effector n=1 Tax=Micromonospora matsumotoense TaxID=121616 RepID=UPI00342F4E61